MATHPDLPAEQSFVDRAYERLDVLRAAAAARMDEVLGLSKGGTHQAREERDVIVRTSLARMAQLDIGNQSLVFGRIDIGPGGGDPTSGDQAAPGSSSGTPGGAGTPRHAWEALARGGSYHIGRLAVSGADLEPLVIDWRAPVAEPFYRATGRDPMGVARRRHFATEGRRIKGIEDEVFLPDQANHLSPDDQDELPQAPGALLAALERSRSSHMRDIVATVQRQQDEVIRAPLPGILAVQGGPGTGKTAVALHRAAYLLYTHRFPLERQGVLVIGPNQVFLGYIGQVLPSLGESGVALSTIDGLVGGVRARADEDPGLARLKGSDKMVRVVAKAVADRQRPLRATLEIAMGASVLRLTRSEMAEFVAATKRRRGPHNARRRYFELLCARRLASKYLAARGRGDETGDERKELVDQVRRLPAAVEAFDRMWPRLSAEELLHDLYGAKPLLKLAAGGILSDRDAMALHRPRSSSINDIPWTPADLALIDEARTLLGPRRGKEDGSAVRTYGHIIVDEAQELSTMQLRVLGRRSISGSMTIVGDLAQATGPDAPRSWEQITRSLGLGSVAALRVVELAVNYRTPAPIAELAAKVLAHAAPDLVAPRSVRQDGSPPEIIRVAPERLVDEVVDRALKERAAQGDRGTIGVISPSALAEEIADGLGLPEPAGGQRRPVDLAEPVAVVPLRWAKGLEFDTVIVVEPAALIQEGSQGLRALYVALTRPTRRLIVLHGRALPESLAS